VVKDGQVIGMVVDVFDNKIAIDTFRSIVDDINGTHGYDHVSLAVIPSNPPTPPEAHYKITVPVGVFSGFKQRIMKRSKADGHIEPEWEGFELQGQEAKKWEKDIRPLVAAIIQTTRPASKIGSTPIVYLYGLSVNRGRSGRNPTLVVACKSKTYRQQISQAIVRSQILVGTEFELLILNNAPQSSDTETQQAESGQLRDRAAVTEKGATAMSSPD
jgi:hypothetical protein